MARWYRDGPAIALLALGSLGYLLMGFAWFSLPAYLTVIIADLGLTDTQAGVVAGAVPLTYVPLALASGLVVDRVGSRCSLGVALVIVGTAQALRAGADGFPTLLALTVLFGVGATGLTFGLPKLVAELFPVEHTGAASSVYVVATYLGTASAFALGRPLLGPALGGWRPLFRWSGAAIVAFGGTWLAASWALRGAFDDSPPGDGRSGLASAAADLRRALGSPQLRLLVVVGVVYLLLVHGLQGWLAAVFESRGVAPARAAQVTSLLVLAQVGGAMTITPLAERLAVRRLAVAGSGTACTLGVTALLVGGAGLAPAVAGVVVVGVGLGGLSTLVRTLPVVFDDVGPELTATAVALVFAVGEIGGFLGPFVVGALRDATGSFVPGLGLLAASGVAVMAAGLGMRRLAGGG